MLTALGYDWVPGNLAGALALAEGGEAVRKVEIGYFITGSGMGGMSGGTMASTAGAMLEPGFAFQGGRVVTEGAARRIRSFDVHGKRLQAVSIGSSEHFTLPPLSPALTDVDCYLGWFGAMSRPMQITLPGPRCDHQGRAAEARPRCARRAVRQGLDRRPDRGGARLRGLLRRRDRLGSRR